MTTEIAIINREAIALAADSAGTVRFSNGRAKIYNSTDKLFSLSNHHPIGVMIYGNSQLTGVPWETLIKVYKNYLKDASFPALSDYCDHFLKFLGNHVHLFPENERQQIVPRIVQVEFLNILEQTKKRIENVSQEENRISDDTINKEFPKTLNTMISQAHEFWQKNENSFMLLPALTDNEFLEKYNYPFDVIINQVFNNYILSEESRYKLKEIAINLLVKQSTSDSFLSGIVIAGFGEDEIFPDLHTYEIEFVFDNHVKYRKVEESCYNNRPISAIIPFAQTDMISMFAYGIEPTVREKLCEILDRKLTTCFEQACACAKDQESNQGVNEIQQTLDALRIDLVNDFRKAIYDHVQESQIAPLMDAVELLPKDELAAMAEALVNLTSLKRRVTTNEESVGGPTDVALISKGDGFVWVKRKHYFDANLNSDYFINKLVAALRS